MKHILLLLTTSLIFAACQPVGTPSESNPPAQEESTGSEQLSPDAANLMTNATVTVPETDGVKVSISTQTGPTVEYGDFENDKTSPYGTVTLLTDYVVPIGETDLASIIAVNSGGSGEFFYLISFTPGEASWQMTSEVPLGDRIDVLSLSSDADTVTITYLEHGPDQAMAEDPNVEVSRTFNYQNGDLIEQ